MEASTDKTRELEWQHRSNHFVRMLTGLDFRERISEFRSVFFNNLLKPSSSPPDPSDGFETPRESCVFPPSHKDIKRATREAVGLLESEIEAKPMIGTLFDVNAMALTSGPFSIELTDVPAGHLTFSGSGNSPILRILRIDKVFELYRVDAIDASR